jgi:DNA-binding HxlR family transcriptional regulator
MRKASSTNTINRQSLETECGMAHTISLIGGRWKLSILGLLLDFGKLRYSELKSGLRGISEKMLSSQLKELENDNLIIRTVHPQVPPKVEYELSEKGESLRKILKEMTIWGDANLNKE